MKNKTIEEEIISLVFEEKQSWEDATCFVTDKIAFQMRNLIRQLRKNYYGIFDEPIDPTTGRKKVWIPLTRFIVDTAVKNIDLDTKDINFISRYPKAVRMTSLLRSAIKKDLDASYFGERLDEAEKVMCIDGTVVWKTFENKDKNDKYKAETRVVDLLNFYIDPTAHSIQETPAVIERSLMTLEEMKSMSGWMNVDGLVGSSTLHKTEENLSGDSGSVGMNEVFERWGLAPKYFITGDKKDTELIETQIVVSNNKDGKKLHYVAKNEKGLKPYEEAWYSRVPNRWYGCSPAEMLIMLQIWINTIINIRINRSYFSQLGIFKIKSNSGITTQTITRLAANSAIVVNSMDDIEQLAMKEASSSSYTDEENIQGWAQKVTSAYESVTGQSMPSSTPATNTIVQQKQAQSTFVMVRKGFGFFLERWLDRHAIPIISKNIKADDIIRISGDNRVLDDLDEAVANKLVYDAIKNTPGKLDPFKVEEERQRVLAKIKSMGKERFYKLVDNIDFTEYDVNVVINDEEMEISVIAQNLIQMLGLFPEARMQISKQVFDLMGLDSNILPEVQAGVVPNQVNPSTANEQQLATAAMTPNITTNSNV